MMTKINEVWPQNELERVNEIEKENRINYTVSIIINNYNYGRFLKGAIDSALHQTYQNTEIIVVDDGSTDNSAEIIREYAETKKIIPILKGNGGQISACNAGFKQSHGEIVLFLDSDDVLLEDAVESIVRVWDNSVNLIIGRLQACDVSLNRLSFFWPTHDQAYSGDELKTNYLKSGHLSGTPTSGNAFATSFLKKVMPQPEKLVYIDLALPQLALLYGKVSYIEKPIGLYRLHGGNIHDKGQEMVRKVSAAYLIKNRILEKTAKELGVQINSCLSYNEWRTILYASILYPEEFSIFSPSESVNPTECIKKGLTSLFYDPYINWKQKVLNLLIILVGALPRTLSKKIIQNYFPRKKTWINAILQSKLYGRNI